MSIKDQTEQVLRDIYILLSNGEAYEGNADKVIIDKNEMVELFNRLNVCIYGMMDEYGISQRGLDKVERDTKKIREDIIRDANKGAEDIYAAAFLYTDEALRRVLELMQNTANSVQALWGKVEQDFKKEQESVKRNKMELKSQLQVFRDTDKYLKLIDEQNKAIEKAKAGKKEKQEESSSYAKVKPEIKVNPEYFEKIGRPLEKSENTAPLSETEKEERHMEELPVEEISAEEIPVEEISAEEIPAEEFPAEEISVQDTDDKESRETAVPEVKVNLDAEYFKWRESGLKLDDDFEEEEKKEEKRSFFGKKRK